MAKLLFELSRADLVSFPLQLARRGLIGCPWQIAVAAGYCLPPVSAVSSFVPRLGPSWRIGDSPLTDPTVQISRSGFFKRIHPLSSGIFSWFEADSRSSFGDIATEF
jgi:hypothetical protein